MRKEIASDERLPGAGPDVGKMGMGSPQTANVTAQGLPDFDQELMRQGLRKLVRRARQCSVGTLSEVA